MLYNNIIVSMGSQKFDAYAKMHGPHQGQSNLQHATS